MEPIREEGYARSSAPVQSQAHSERASGRVIGRVVECKPTETLNSLIRDGVDLIDRRIQRLNILRTNELEPFSALCIEEALEKRELERDLARAYKIKPENPAPPEEPPQLAIE